MKLIEIKTARELRNNKILKVKVAYNDRTKKHLPLQYWEVFRNDIIKNLYLKNLCKIKFVKMRWYHYFWAFVNVNYRIKHFIFKRN